MAKRRKKKPEAGIVAVGYVRCSRGEQTPEAQSATLGAWALDTNASLVAVFFDIGVSGAAPIADRPGLVAALAFLRADRANALLVARRDRLARDVAIACSIERWTAKVGAKVLCADGSHAEENALGREIDDLVSAEERRRTIRRTRDALAIKRARGEVTGQPRYGFDASHKRVNPEDLPPVLIPNEKEQQCLARARELDAAGYSYTRIAETLTEEGFLNRSGRPWVKQRLFLLLQRSP